MSPIGATDRSVRVVALITAVLGIVLGLIIGTWFTVKGMTRIA